MLRLTIEKGRPMSRFLDPADIRRVTRKRSIEDQQRALQQQGIPFKLVGRQLLVAEAHMLDWLAGKPTTPTRRPNLSGVT